MWTFATGRFWALVAVMLVIAGVDPLLPANVLILSFLWVPVVASAAFAGPVATALLAGLSVVLHLAVGVSQSYTSTPAFWIRLLAMSLVSGLATYLSARTQQDRVRLEDLALTDSLTGLANRRLLLLNLQQELRRQQRTGTPIALLYIDLDRFKQVNTAHDHAGGDAILRQIADRFNAQLRAGDTLARLGGDEFAALCPSCKTEQDAEVMSARLLSVAHIPFEQPAVSIGATIGAVLIPPSSTQDAQSVLTVADQQVMRLKNAQERGTYAVQVL